MGYTFCDRKKESASFQSYTWEDINAAKNISLWHTLQFTK